MGLFDFIKEAGTKILPGTGPKKKPAAAPAAPTKSPAEAQREQDRRRALALLEHVQGLRLGVTDLQIEVAGDKVTVRGKAPSQEVREKVILALGNVAGVARVDDQLEVVKKEPEAVFYTVKRGDTLSAIAKAHYGNANKYMVIFEANQPLLKDPDKIYPGQVLRIPPAAS